jgi:hypothetical protein
MCTGQLGWILGRLRLGLGSTQPLTMQVSEAVSAGETGQIMKLQDVPRSATAYRNTHTHTHTPKQNIANEHTANRTWDFIRHWQETTVEAGLKCLSTRTFN